MQVTHSDGEILDKIKKLFTYGRETKKIFAPINKNTLFLIRHSLIFYLFSYDTPHHLANPTYTEVH
jgi:hypothetical protein